MVVAASQGNDEQSIFHPLVERGVLVVYICSVPLLIRLTPSLLACLLASLSLHFSLFGTRFFSFSFSLDYLGYTTIDGGPTGAAVDERGGDVHRPSSWLLSGSSGGGKKVLVGCKEGRGRAARWHRQGGTAGEKKTHETRTKQDTNGHSQGLSFGCREKQRRLEYWKWPQRVSVCSFSSS